MATRGKSAEAKAKENRGQDEIVHTVYAPDGTSFQTTQRDWKENYRGKEGYSRAEFEPTPDTEPEPEPVEPPATEPEAVEPATGDAVES